MASILGSTAGAHAGDASERARGSAAWLQVRVSARRRGARAGPMRASTAAAQLLPAPPAGAAGGARGARRRSGGRGAHRTPRAARARDGDGARARATARRALARSSSRRTLRSRRQAARTRGRERRLIVHLRYCIWFYLT